MTNRTSNGSSVHRRGFMQLGAYSALGATLNCGLPRRTSASIATSRPIKACILVAHYGGPSHIDTWDMKPDGPAEIRGALRLPKDMPAKRLVDRNELLEQLNDLAPQLDDKMQAFRERAVTLLGNEHVQRAFNIAKEPTSVRDRYGRNKFGQSMLLARRLVEAGVPFVNVNDKRINGQNANWDSHKTLFARHKQLLPPMDPIRRSFGPQNSAAPATVRQSSPTATCSPAVTTDASTPSRTNEISMIARTIFDGPLRRALDRHKDNHIVNESNDATTIVSGVT